MSTKIYTAYRAKPGVDLFAMVRDLRAKGEASATAILRDFYAQIMASGDTQSQSDAWQSLIAQGYDMDAARLNIAQRTIRKGYREQLNMAERNAFDLDVSISIREHGGVYYLLPFCDMTMGKALDFMREHPDLEDFAYWNNSDEPEHVTREAWEERGRIWDAIDDAGWSDYVTLSIVSCEGFHRVDPWLDMAREQSAAQVTT